MQSQLNVRIDEKLRQEGNLAFESIGLTPSQVIRSIWTYAANNRNHSARLRKLKHFLENKENPEIQSELEYRESLVEKGRNIVPEFCIKHGLSLEPSEFSYEELKFQAYKERYEERGLLRGLL